MPSRNQLIVVICLVFCAVFAFSYATMSSTPAPRPSPPPVTVKQPNIVCPTVYPADNGDLSKQLAIAKERLASSERKLRLQLGETWLMEELYSVQAMKDNMNAWTSSYNQNAGFTDPSGYGSTPDSTKETVPYITSVLTRYNVTTMLDAPCGSFSWMRNVQFEALGIQYYGADLIEQAIQTHRKNFADRPNLHFSQLDLTRRFLYYDALPPWAFEKGFDIIITRHAVMHMSFISAIRAIRNLESTGSKYIMITNFPESTVNHDIPDGQLNFKLVLFPHSYRYTPHNLMNYPFNLPTPLECWKDSAGDLCLWKLPFQQTPGLLSLKK